jgi:hypothetical protein
MEHGRKDKQESWTIAKETCLHMLPRFASQEPQFDSGIECLLYTMLAPIGVCSGVDPAWNCFFFVLLASVLRRWQVQCVLF